MEKKFSQEELELLEKSAINQNKFPKEEFIKEMKNYFIQKNKKINESLIEKITITVIDKLERRSFFNQINFVIKRINFIYEKDEKATSQLIVHVTKKIKSSLINYYNTNDKTKSIVRKNKYGQRKEIFKQIKSVLKNIKLSKIEKLNLDFYSFLDRSPKIEILQTRLKIAEILCKINSSYPDIEVTLKDKKIVMTKIYKYEKQYLDVSIISDFVIEEAKINAAFDPQYALSKINKNYMNSVNNINIDLYNDYENLIIDLQSDGVDLSKERLVIENQIYAYKHEEDQIDYLLSVKIKDLKNIKDKYLIEKSIVKKQFKDMYPMARTKQRKIKLFVGETNSGKTYSSFKCIQGKNNGLFLAPLRLLALEGQENIEEMGYPCNLLTGEEQDVKPEAQFCSSTIEMLNIEKEYDIVIIDEIQMIFDKERGWAWTQALVGANAKEIVLTGSKEAIEAVKFLADYTGDTLEIIELEKKTKLEKIKQKVKTVKEIPDHTAVVCFSKKRILDLKNKYENETGKKASVIFGALAPETRREESRRFRENETMVVFATDAIGMGLNLPIKNVLFDSLEKSNGVPNEKQQISSALAKQIAGRAGRYKYYDNGYYGMFGFQEIDELEELLKAPYEEHENKFFYKVPFTVFEELSMILDTFDCYEIMSKFISNYDLIEDNFIKTDYTKLLEKAKIIEYYSMNIKVREHQIVHKMGLYEKYQLIFSPIDIDHDETKFLFESIVRKILRKTDFDFNKELLSKMTKIVTIEDLNEIETNLKGLDAYNWLSFNFKDIFKIDMNEIKKEKSILNDLVQFFLKEDGKLQKKCRICNIYLDLEDKSCCQRCIKRKRK